MDSEENIKTREIAKQSNVASRFLKILWLIPILAIGYIGWINVMPLRGTITYSIDVGAEDSSGNPRITGPFDRISDKKEGDGTSFRELEGQLVYFELDDFRLGYADEVGVRIRFKDNFPGDTNFLLAGRDEEEWSYDWREVYIPFYGKLADLPSVARSGSVQVYATHKASETDFRSIGDFLGNPPLESVIGTNDKGLSINQRVSPEEYEGIDAGDFVSSEEAFPVALDSHVGKNDYFETTTSLRGMHTFYLHHDGGVSNLEIAKRDLNLYEGEDMLEVLVFSLDGTLEATVTVTDDGDSTNSGNLGPVQYGTLRLNNLERGTYRLVLKPVGEGNDFVITYLKLNQTKLVTAARVFLAGGLYLGEQTGTMTVWCELFSESEIKLSTPHNPTLQKVTISADGYGQNINLDAVGTKFGTGFLEPGKYKITSEKGNIIIEASSGYFAFTEDSLFVPASSSNGEENGSLLINTALRGGHTLWTYVTADPLQLEVTKQDLNFYEGPDELAIEVYSLGGELKGTAVIPDDGDEDATKTLGPLQRQSLTIEHLEPGPYRIGLKGDSDLLIRKIKINQTKLVVDKRVFPAGTNLYYFKDGLVFDPVKLYGKNFAAGQLKFRVYHNTALQQVRIQAYDFDTEVDINEKGTDFSTSLKPGSHQLTVPRQNVIIESSGYLSFTPNSFFLPKRCEVVDFKYDLPWALQNVDYIMVNYDDYVPPVEDDGWLVAGATWKREELFISNDKLSFCLNAPHLSKEPARSVPVDWIEIEIKVLPLHKRVPWLDQVQDRLSGTFERLTTKVRMKWLD